MKCGNALGYCIITSGNRLRADCLMHKLRTCFYFLFFPWIYLLSMLLNDQQCSISVKELLLIIKTNVIAQ